MAAWRRLAEPAGFQWRNPLPEGVKVGDSVRFEMLQRDKRQWEIVGISRE